MVLDTAACVVQQGIREALQRGDAAEFVEVVACLFRQHSILDLLSMACACEWLAVCHVCLSHLLLVTACDYCCSSKAGNDRYYMFVVISATVFHGRLTCHKKYSGQISMPYLSLNLPQHSNMTGCLVLHLLMIQLKQSHCYDTGDEAGARGVRTTQAAR